MPVGKKDTCACFARKQSSADRGSGQMLAATVV